MENYQKWTGQKAKPLSPKQALRLQDKLFRLKEARKLLRSQVDRKENSIQALIIRMKELEEDLIYETRLNEQLRSFIENNLKINAK